MNVAKPEPSDRSELVVLGTASSDTLGLPVADVPEPMGFWVKNGISDE